jgi:hypothetical protein
MFRHLILASAAVAGLTASLGLATPASAAFIDVRVGPRYYPVYRPVPVVVPAPVTVYSPPPVVVVERPVCRHFLVQYRACCNEPWREYGAYHFRERALEAEAALRARGFEAIIIHR